MHKWTNFARKLALVATIVALMAGTLGCHTIRGMGRDVQSVGRGVEDVASE